MMKWPIKIESNKYLLWYQKLVQQAKQKLTPEGYTEKHHIIPRSLGGSNDADNLVILTARQHYIAHLLLWKIDMPARYHNKMVMALNIMVNGSGHKKQDRSYLVNSRIYEAHRKEYAKVLSESMKGELNRMYGRKHTVESLQKMSENNAMKRPEVREKVTGENNPMWGKTHSDAMKSQISQSVSRYWQQGENTTAQSKRIKDLWANEQWKQKSLESRFNSEGWQKRDWKTIAKKSAETRKANGNNKMTEEQKNKLSETRRNKLASGEIVPWNKGKKTANYRTPESARAGALKAAATRKINGTQVSMKGKNNPFYGRKHSEETKAKIRATKLANKARQTNESI